MTKYLFRFGFCTPTQWELNDKHGWDDESSEAFFVEADSTESAELWGCEVAEAFVHSLFVDSGWSGDIPSWKESGFSFWIESDVNALPPQYLEQRPVVVDGKKPDFSDWSK